MGAETKRGGVCYSHAPVMIHTSCAAAKGPGFPSCILAARVPQVSTGQFVEYELLDIYELYCTETSNVIYEGSS